MPQGVGVDVLGVDPAVLAHPLGEMNT